MNPLEKIIAEIIERKFGCYTETAELVAREIIEAMTQAGTVTTCEAHQPKDTSHE